MSTVKCLRYNIETTWLYIDSPYTWILDLQKKAKKYTLCELNIEYCSFAICHYLYLCLDNDDDDSKDPCS